MKFRPQANIEYVFTDYCPKEQDKEIEVCGIVILQGTEIEMINLLNENICDRPFVNQVSNLTEMRACYKVGFRPYGQSMTYQQAVQLLHSRGSICMTINI
ncbi:MULTISPECIES: hypothetical protein [Bacillus]|uniref:hypothetical protein n=1 Tax=Bacillus TaxID=1386 RepID=UPI001F51906C|nr:hypothetical protein [Bacillus sp. TL12]MCI0767242.1 hypothetical protein [Bacillus sp. TL12]